MQSKGLSRVVSNTTVQKVSLLICFEANVVGAGPGREREEPGREGAESDREGAGAGQAKRRGQVEKGRSHEKGWGRQRRGGAGREEGIGRREEDRSPVPDGPVWDS